MYAAPLILLDCTMKDFHLRLRTFRGSSEPTQSRLPELLGISPRVYTRWENGDATPLFGTVVKIAGILNVTLHELAGRQDAAEAEPRIKNPELHRLYRKVDLPTGEDQKALPVVLDSLVKRSRMDPRLAQ